MAVIQFKRSAQESIDVVMLLSMSKLAGSEHKLGQRQQTPQDCLDMMDEIEKRFAGASVNFRFLYTDALYLNKNEQAAKAAERVLFQMTRHQEGIQKIAGDRDIAFGSWNQAILDNNKGGFESALTAMRNRYVKDKEFAAQVNGDTLAAKRGHEPDRHDVEFVLQELTVMEMIRRQATDVNKVVIAYPGEPLKSDLYLRDSKRPHPLGKASPVEHRAFWADVSGNNQYSLHEYDLPKPKEEKKDNSLHKIAASIAFAVFAAAAAGISYYSFDKPEPEFTLTDNNGGVILLKRNERTYIFPERSAASNQIVIFEGRQVAANTRDDGYLMCENAGVVREYLKTQNIPHGIKPC